MIETRTALRSIATAGVIALLCACSGTGSPPVGAVPAGSSGASLLSQPFLPDKCKSDHGVSVNPCRMTLTTSNPYQTATVTYPSGSTVTVEDRICTKKTIAVVEGEGSTWDVTAGTNRGKCVATFVAKKSGKKLGEAKLTITNQV